MHEDITIAEPWYRDRWPWLIMSVPAISAVLGIAMLMLAMGSYDGLVAEDYYKQGLAINEVLDKEAHAARLGVQADMKIVGERLTVVLRGGQANPGALILRLAHPTRANEDLKLRLRMSGVQTYEAAWPQLGEGRWRVILEDEAGTWRVSALWPHAGAKLSLGAEASK